MAYNRYVLTGLLAAALVPGVALAQTASPQPSASTLDEVVVTAQRRTERSVDVPISITSVSRDQLNASGVRRAYDLTNVIPALRVDEDGPYVEPTLRGVGNAVAGAGANPAVATYIDGFYQPSQLGANYDFVGVDSIQVLKGPQGTLFGRNATGGAIVVKTRDPGFEPSGEALLGYGRFNDIRAEFYGSTGLTDSLAVSISGGYHKSDGFTRDVASGRHSGRIDKHTVRAKLLWKPTDDFSALLAVEQSHTRDDSGVAYTSFNGLNNVAVLAGALHFPLPAGGVVAPTQRGQTASSEPNSFGGWDNKIYLTITKDFGDFARLTSYTQHQEEDYTWAIDFDATAVPVYRARETNPGQTFSQEFNLSSKAPGPLQWVTGLFYYRNVATVGEYKQRGYLIDPAAATLLDNMHTGQITKSYAAFADGTWEAVDNLFLTVGIRYSKEDQYGYAQHFPSGVGTVVPPGKPTSGQQKFHAFTPRVVLRYNFAPDANVYASFSRGFKAGGFATTDFSSYPVMRSFKPEKIEAYEAGIKMRTGRVNLEGAIYRNKYTNQQVAYYTSGVGHIDNAASSQMYGIEGQITARLTDELTIGANGSYIHARYKSFTNATRSLLSGTVAIDVSGQRMLRTPDFTGTAFANYVQPVGDGTLTLNGSVYMTSKINLDPSGAYTQGGYALVNARATYAFPGDRYAIAVYGENLADKTYTASVLPFSPFSVLQQYGKPRTFGVELTAKF